ncbi:DUF2231 domain-containing protein [Nocardioides sp.]|jgi:uncharacterized membrane protein|uniref:DUF2231 domain-containing protein n=1 Tax=Nocardioides sp. TaxID=35761 RepID=UPI0031FE94DB|nr:hypothetical protein [Nocardioides sp.]
MEIVGLPLHPLVVHAAVVFGPIAALTAILYVVLPSWRDRLRWPMLALAVLATVTIWVAFLSGQNFRNQARFDEATGAWLDRLDKHQSLAQKLRWVTSGFFVVAVLSAWLHERTGAVRVVLGVLLAASAIATLVFVVLTGDAGARAVWTQ